jgi:hypothetical protein
VTQLGTTAPPNCTFSLSAPSNVIGSGGGNSQVTLTTANVSGGCPWNAKSDVDWLTINAPSSGVGSAVIVAAASPNAGGQRSGTIDVAGQKATIVQQGTKAGLPFGVVDTPADNLTGVTGSIAVTGWALDDKGVVAIEIYRETVPGEPGARCRPFDATSPNCLFVGSGVFIKGSRPDVQALYGAMPNSDRAGWGYLLLSNQLPSQGTGTFRLIVLARDTDNSIDPNTGALPEIGRKTITFANSTATTPFGGIDTPDQGGTAQGTSYINFGWALTPLPKTIAKTGATIGVFLDSVNIGSPTYDQPRSDITALFPGLNNSNGPVGFFRFNTTVLVDGLHTIAWVVTDDAGSASGIGSRFFRVQNGTSLFGSSMISTTAEVQSISALPVSAVPVQVGLGFAAEPDRSVPADRTGTRHVAVRVLDVVRLSLGDRTGVPYEGYAVSGSSLEPLPSGSTFDARDGTFGWQLGPGFIGVYDLVFVRNTIDGTRERIPVRVVVEPNDPAAATPLVVETPNERAIVDYPFVVSGRTLTGDSRQVRDVFVYAYPADGSAPIFVGQAAVGAERPDADEPFGGQFAKSGYSITVKTLAPGTYDLLVVARSVIAAELNSSAWVRGVSVK